MYAVGRLGSYITRGVYTVSGSFHPFGGAVDIIVVEQPDGSFKSSPWYVRFGKFQGVLKAREKIVNICVNGIDANFHMYLDNRGEAYFLREVEGDEGESVLSSYSDEADEPSQKRMPLKSKSCNFDLNQSNTCGQIDGNNGKIVARTSSRRSRIFGLVFGQSSMKEDGYRDENNGDDDGVVRMSSLDRAEIAANLLDVKWSTNLASSRSRKGNASQFSASYTSEGTGVRDRPNNDGQSQVGSSVQVVTENSMGHYMLAEETGSCNMQMGTSSHSGFENGKFSVEESSVAVSSLGATEQIVETFVLDESSLEEISGISRGANEPGLQNPDENSHGMISEVACSDSQIQDVIGESPSKKFDQEQFSDERNVAVAEVGIYEETGSNRTQSFIYCENSENSLVGLDGSKEQSAETLYLASGGPGDINFFAETLHVTTEFLLEDTVTQQAEEIELETLCTESCDNHPQLANPSPPLVRGHDEVNLEVSLAEPKSYTQMVTVDPACGLTEVQSTSSSFTNSVCQFENGINFGDKITSYELQPSLESVGGSEQLDGDRELEKAVSVPSSGSLEQLDGDRELEKAVSVPASGISGQLDGDHELAKAVSVPASESSEQLDGDHELAKAVSIPASESSEQLDGDCKLAKAVSVPSSESSEQLDGDRELAKAVSVPSSESSEQLDGYCELAEAVSVPASESSEQLDGDRELAKAVSVPASESSEQPDGDHELARAVSVTSSESSEEEQFIFGDLDDFKHKEIQGKLNFSDGVVEENNPSCCPEGTDEVNGPLSVNDESFSSGDSFFQKNQFADDETLMGNSREASSPISIPNLNGTADVRAERLAESLPNMWSCSDNMDAEDLQHPLSHSVGSDSKSLEWKLNSKDELCCINSDIDKENQSSPEPSNNEDSPHPEIKNSVANPAVGDPSKDIATTGGNWSLWPFNFRRSGSRIPTPPTVTDNKSSDVENVPDSNIDTENDKNIVKPELSEKVVTAVTDNRSSDVENVSDSNIDTENDKNIVKPKLSKKMVRAISPISEELASLNLKDGSNTVTFTFSTSMLGKQKVDARIYLWKWNTRIVISDVDGTITKSDVLGQFMPLVGMDWSQTGVAPLFSAIKENGYQLLFLSARAISQAYHTRQFLVNLKQSLEGLHMNSRLHA
ncbi:phosphatidate phosphatase PAH2 isoform X2 [Manihot esculenta]|uniref:phosphatidate phosphatase PAH2 isoform X2 n=1 Tax=Manihot esculenta TaxID=3983 RepID=UPI001CC439DE|nr:phosphatidate phosphatase PAH2 isoform X2 [Manihot esculenta]